MNYTNYYKDYSGKRLVYFRNDVRIIQVGFNQHYKHPNLPSKAIVKIQNSYKGQREYNMYRKLRHSNILRAYCHYIENNKSYLFLETGKIDLFEEIKNRRKSIPSRYYSERDLFTIFFKISKAVAFMHSKNIAHRDIKPLNIVLNTDNELKLIDVGESKFIKKDDRMHTIIGTIPYMSPDLIQSFEQNTANRDPFADDVWAIGVTIVELAFLDVISNIASDREKIQDIVAEMLKERNYSRGFIKLILKTLEPDTSRRIKADKLIRKIHQFGIVTDETMCIYYPIEATNKFDF